VLSFKPSSKAPAEIESFDADVLDFFSMSYMSKSRKAFGSSSCCVAYLVQNQNVSDSQVCPLSLQIYLALTRLLFSSIFKLFRLEQRYATALLPDVLATESNCD
jgi:hypothetical protein